MHLCLLLVMALLESLCNDMCASLMMTKTFVLLSRQQPVQKKRFWRPELKGSILVAMHIVVGSRHQALVSHHALCDCPCMQAMMAVTISAPPPYVPSGGWVTQSAFPSPLQHSETISTRCSIDTINTCRLQQ